MKNWLILMLFLPVLPMWATDPVEDALSVTRYPTPAEKPNAILIQDATLWTQTDDGKLTDTDILIRDGKIAKIGKDLNAPRGAMVIDAKGLHVTPGLIDAHSHSAVEGGFASSVNEATNNVTAEVRIRDTWDPWSPAMYRELAGGLTSGNLLHGSANSIGGQNMIFKYRWGAVRTEDFVIDTAPQGIKFALGENPMRVGGSDRYPNSRMGVINSIRMAFEDALAYGKRMDDYQALSPQEQAQVKPPRKNLQLDAILEILRGERQIHSHGYRQDEFLSLMRLAQEYDVQIATFQHVLEGYKIADEMAAAGIGGSTFADWWAYKFEAYDAIPQNAALMHQRGVVSSVNSDDEVLARRLNIEASKSLRYGLSEVEALGLVTNYPAQQLGIADRVGSLAEDMDGDVVIWSGHPLKIDATPEYTIVEGVPVFSRAADRAHREKIAAARATLIEALREEAAADDAAKSPEESAKEESTAEESAAEESAAEESAVAATDEGKSKDDATEETAPNEDAKPKANPAAQASPYQLSAYAKGQISAIVGGTIHTLVDDPIENGVVLLKDGRIERIGGPGTKVPDGYEVFDAKGQHVWPGIFHAWSFLGLYEVGSVSLTVDQGEFSRFDPELKVVQAFNADSQHIPVARSAGITHALVRPRNGNLTGVAAIMKTAGWTYEDMAAQSHAAVVLGWPEGDSGQNIKERQQTSQKAIEKISEFFDNAALYRKAKEAAAANDRPFNNNTKYDAMIPILDGSWPLYIDVRTDWAIKAAHAWCAERDLRMVVVGGEDAWKITDYLVDNNLPVILTSALRSPNFYDEPYDVGYSQPAKLAEAGVLFAIAGAENGAAHLRNVVEHAGTPVGFGLNRMDAYRAITLNPAKMFGLEADLGSLEAGKVANIIVTDGDILEASTVVNQVWVDGMPADMMDKQKRLYDKYKDRPQVD